MKKRIFGIGCLLCGMPLALALAQPANPPPVPRPAATVPAGPAFTILSITHDVDYQRDTAERYFLTMQVALDPGTTISEASQAAWVSKAIDDAGNSLAFGTPMTQYVGGGVAPVDHVLRITVSLKPPPESAKRGTTLKLLEGQIQGIAVKSDKVMFTIPGGLDRTWGNFRMVCGSKKLGDSQILVGRLFIPTPGTTDMAAFDAARRRVTRFVVKDAAGNIWKEKGRNYGDGVKDEDQTMFDNPGNTPPTGTLTASFEVPLGTTAVNIPFKLENIPLP